MAVNLPSAYSKVLDAAFKLESLTAPAFKGKYKVIGGTTKSFQIFSVKTQALRDYSTRKSANGANFGYEYKDAENEVQTVTASKDMYFAMSIDKADAHFAADGSLDAREVMKEEISQEIVPTIDKHNLSVLANAATAVVKATTNADAYETFSSLMTKQTNAKVPRVGRIAFFGATEFAKIKLDPKFAIPSELSAHSRRTGNYGMIDGCLVIEVPDDYLPTKFTCILTHESIGAAPKHLADYNQGPFKETASGFYVNGRVVFDAFVFNQRKSGLFALKSAA